MSKTSGPNRRNTYGIFGFSFWFAFGCFVPGFSRRRALGRFLRLVPGVGFYGAADFPDYFVTYRNRRLYLYALFVMA